MKSLSKSLLDPELFIPSVSGNIPLLIKACLVLLVWKAALVVVPLNVYVKRRSTLNTYPLPASRLVAVTWAVTRLSSRLPLQFTCLVQALSVKWLLRRYAGVQLLIGVHKSKELGFLAHAWVVYQNRIVLGDQSGTSFTPILEWE